jgi:Ca-activated chloride channel family protein
MLIEPQSEDYSAESPPNFYPQPTAPLPSLDLPGLEQPEAGRTQPGAGMAPPEWSPPEERYIPPSPPDNTFQDYGVNPYTDTRGDHLSTFAVDVDTAAYAVARRYLSDGLLPPPEAVRVEEFINYFDQNYPDPGRDVFGIYADGAPSPFEYGTTLLRVGIQGRSIHDWVRKSANLVFVIDVSGSMGMEYRLEMVKGALETLVNNLYNDDSVAIVVYGSSARVMLKPTSARNSREILKVIRRLEPEGATNAEAGLRLGYDLAMRAYKPDGINRVILCSDGVANVGMTEANAILETVGGYVDEGVTLTSVGFGMGNYNDVLMEQLADKGNGSYAYVDTLEEAQKIFGKDLTSTLQVIGLDAKVQVDFNPEIVAYYRLMGYENRDVADSDFRNDRVDAGEIGAGHSVTALYAVRLQPDAEGRIATVQFRWQDPDSYEVRELNRNLNTWDLAARFEKADPYFQLTAVVGQFAEILRQNPWAVETPFEMVMEYAYSLPRSLRNSDEVREFLGLVEQAAAHRW